MWFALGLGVEPFMSALGADIDEVHFASNRPVVPLEPGHKSVDDSLLITAHSATLETALKPRQGSAVRGNLMYASLVLAEGDCHSEGSNAAASKGLARPSITRGRCSCRATSADRNAA
jgi:hypothetical protein